MMTSPEDSVTEDLTLSSADIARFQRCMRAMLSPLEHEHPDEWRARVNRALKPLLGADMVTFQLPHTGVEFLYSDEVDMAHLRRHLPSATAFDPKGLSRVAELQVCNRRMLWRDKLNEYYGSAYYSEFVVPVRAFDMLTAATHPDGANLPAALYLHHESKRARPFGDRGLRLLRLLHPAFEAGVRTFHRFHARRECLFRMLDAVDDTVCVFDLNGKLLHRSRGYRELTLADAEDEALSTVAGELARNLAALCSARRSRGLSERSHVARTVRVGARTFRLEGSLLEGMGIGTVPSLLVTIREDGLSPTPASGARDAETYEGVSHISERFDLTPRQAEVAALLAQRLTNREVAERLGISVHTARHHTERVLARLGIHSRREVTGVLSDLRMSAGGRA